MEREKTQLRTTTDKNDILESAPWHWRKDAVVSETIQVQPGIRQTGLKSTMHIKELGNFSPELPNFDGN